MPELVACLSTGKGSWSHISRLMDDKNWSKIFLITNEYGLQNFKAGKNTELIAVNADQGLRELRDEIYSKLKEKIKDTEVGLNLASGTGKEHMALLSAMLMLGIGIRLTAVTKNGIEEI